jgi:hypothetical protein
MVTSTISADVRFVKKFMGRIGRRGGRRINCKSPPYGVHRFESCRIHTLMVTTFSNDVAVVQTVIET